MAEMLWPVVDKIHPQTNKFVAGVKNKTTSDSKLHVSPLAYWVKHLSECSTEGHDTSNA